MVGIFVDTDSLYEGWYFPVGCSQRYGYNAILLSGKGDSTSVQGD